MAKRGAEGLLPALQCRQGSGGALACPCRARPLQDATKLPGLPFAGQGARSGFEESPWLSASKRLGVRALASA